MTYMSFTGFAFYIAVRCGFDKHLYLTSCLNAHNHNTCLLTLLPQTGCTARKMALFIIIEDRQTQIGWSDQIFLSKNLNSSRYKKYNGSCFMYLSEILSKLQMFNVTHFMTFSDGLLIRVILLINHTHLIFLFSPGQNH